MHGTLGTFQGHYVNAALQSLLRTPVTTLQVVLALAHILFILDQLHHTYACMHKPTTASVHRMHLITAVVYKIPCHHNLTVLKMLQCSQLSCCYGLRNTSLILQFPYTETWAGNHFKACTLNPLFNDP